MRTRQFHLLAMLDGKVQEARDLAEQVEREGIDLVPVHKWLRDAQDVTLDKATAVLDLMRRGE